MALMVQDMHGSWNEKKGHAAALRAKKQITIPDCPWMGRVMSLGGYAMGGVMD